MPTTIVNLMVAPYGMAGWDSREPMTDIVSNIRTRARIRTFVVALPRHATEAGQGCLVRLKNGNVKVQCKPRNMRWVHDLKIGDNFEIIGDQSLWAEWHAHVRYY